MPVPVKSGGKTRSYKWPSGGCCTDNSIAALQGEKHAHDRYVLRSLCARLQTAAGPHLDDLVEERMLEAQLDIHWRARAQDPSGEWQ